MNKVVIENGDIPSYEKMRSRRSDYKIDSNTMGVESKGECAVHGCTSKGAPLEKDWVVSYHCTFHVEVPIRQGWVEVVV